MKIKELYKGRYSPKTIRRKGWDYTSSAMYMVTMCAKDRIHWFGYVEDGKMVLSDIGKIVAEHWLKITDHFTCATLDHFVIMPDHMHGIINIRNSSPKNHENSTNHVESLSFVETRYTASLQTKHAYEHGRVLRKFGSLQPRSLSVVMNTFKGSITRWANQNDYEDFKWQPRFHDHRIQSEQELNAYRKYIDQKPENWVENNEEADWDNFTPNFS